VGVGFVGRRTLSAEELAGDVELLAADDDDLLAVQQLLGDGGRQAAEEVALAVDDNLVRPSVYHIPNIQCSNPPPVRCALRCACKLYRGMRTTGSKVDILAVVSIRNEVCRRTLLSSVSAWYSLEMFVASPLNLRCGLGKGCSAS